MATSGVSCGVVDPMMYHEASRPLSRPYQSGAGDQLSSAASVGFGGPSMRVSEDVSRALGAKPIVRPKDHSKLAVIQSICAGPASSSQRLPTGLVSIRSARDD